MTPERPSATAGLRHIALFVVNFEETVEFYRNLLGMAVEWQPDGDNVYLCSGNDNLALHRARDALARQGQKLDHIGFILNSPEDVDAWHAYLQARQVRVLNAPKTHRDGARSFYCLDPDGTQVQMIYHPPIAGQTFSANSA